LALVPLTVDASASPGPTANLLVPRGPGPLAVVYEGPVRLEAVPLPVVERS
jgi:hypothetical protein